MNHVFELYFSTNNIKLAYRRIWCWSDRMIKDSVGLKAFGANLNKNAQDLSGKIITQKYKPQKGFKFYAPKSSGTQRTKTLLFMLRTTIPTPILRGSSLWFIAKI